MPAVEATPRAARRPRGAVATTALLLLAAEVGVFLASTVPGVRGGTRFHDLLDGWLQGAAYVTTAVVAVLGSLRAERHRRGRPRARRAAPRDEQPAPAERCRLIQEIDRVVIRKSLQFAGEGHAVSLNVSAAALGDPTLRNDVDELLVAHHVRPGLVVFEITETALVEDEDSAERFVRGVTARGCGVALDDFGTGYGGFRYLKRLPVGALKIDREFVTHLVDGSADMHVVEAVVRLARGLELDTIAEGVEDPALVARLRELGVDRGQGFALGRPRPAREVFGS